MCNNFNLNFIYGIVCVYVCVCVFSFRQESPVVILGDDSPLFRGGFVIDGNQSKIGVKHTLKHLKVSTALSVRNV
jgi:hypothetical protein